MGTLKSELKKAVPVIVKATKTLHQRSIPELYADFCQHMRDVSVIDPLGRTIVFRVENFPYLIKMQYFNEKEGKWVSALASMAIAALANGTFDEARHKCDPARAKGMLRIREILTKPDSIHENIHSRVKGEFVYVVRLGAGNIKVAFITKNEAQEWVVVTSFYSTERYLVTCAKVPAAYTK